ncbi:hypothetical protein SASPL_116134 [Salvia splendens]|uniref:SWIM-type domain-containing protein n=1 Tax=Salvia splendens TaxID=180675 RepID=A0A8X8Y9F4_SALSN|nr:hypothetical protein SASPL_116134 [Salvia splendens]
MDVNEGEEVQNHENDADVRMSNNLDLNVEHDCRSPKSSNVKGVRSRRSLKHDVLKLGTEFDSDEQAYRFYHKYAELVGFSVRKDWVNRSKVHGRVMSRKFTCSRQGHRKKDKRDINVKKHRKETRTGCLAYMVVTRQTDGKYIVTQFEAEHNHEDVNLTKAERLLESASGKEDCTEVPETESLKNSEIQLKLSFQMLGIRFCPPENFDDLQIEDDVFLSSRRTRDMKEGDAARLMYYFQRQHFVNPSFFYSLQLDIDDKVSNIFWADDNMITEYGHFGDVVCLDTSCTRNKSFRPLVQFVGLNNHRQVVIFGAAFLYDDSVDSFKWLVQTFVQAMSGKKPKFILSDQDATVVQAIHAVLPETSHCICAWQMYLIALKHLRHVVKEYDSFLIDLRSCIFGHWQEEDFIQAWDSMLERHCLSNNAWLRWMYREKEKWAVAYDRNTFFVERNGTHLVELLSDKLRSCLGPDIDVLQFFKHFKNVVNEQRYRELESTLDMGRHAPVLMANAILLKHPSETYTPKAFEVFQREYEKCLNVIIDKCGERGTRTDYKAKTYGKSRDFLVAYNSFDGTVSCNCMKFEHVGFLCSHALKVLDHQNIKVVPHYYILKRWAKDARILPIGESHICVGDDNRKIIATRYKDLCRNIMQISARAAESDPAFEYASRKIDEVSRGIERILNFKTFDEAKGPCASDNGLAGVGLDRNDFENQDVDVMKGTTEAESIVPDKDQLNHCGEQIPGVSGSINIRPSPPETLLSVTCAPPTYISPPIPAPSLSPLTQGLYTIESSHMVQNMYQASNLTINQQVNPNMYEPSSFFTGQHHSPSHAQLLQESLIHSQFQDPVSNGNQLKQVGIVAIWNFCSDGNDALLTRFTSPDPCVDTELLVFRIYIGKYAIAGSSVVRLTSGTNADWRSVLAAVKIQSAFRAYLVGVAGLCSVLLSCEGYFLLLLGLCLLSVAKRALSALKGLVKLQALVRGHIVRKQSADMLYRMQTMAKIQARASAHRSYTDARINFFSSSNHTGVARIGENTERPNSGKHGGSLPKQHHSRSYVGNKEKSSHLTSRWLNHWMEQSAWNNIPEASLESGHDDDEKNDNILEIDTWKPRDRAAPNSHYFSAWKNNDLGQDHSKRVFSKLQKPINPSISSEEARTADNSPRVNSASSRQTSNLRAPFTPARSECSRSAFGDYLSHPNYMANTKSSRAKLRSHSAPKQRTTQQHEALALSAATHGCDPWNINMDTVSEKGSAYSNTYIESGLVKRQGTTGNDAGYGRRAYR